MRNSWLVAATLLASGVVLAGCTSATSGVPDAGNGAPPSTGSPSGSASNSAAPPSDSPAPIRVSTVAPTPSTGRVSVSVSVSPSPSPVAASTDAAAPAGGGESTDPAPADCPDGSCRELSHSAVKGGYQIVLRAGTGSGVDASAVVELVAAGRPVQWDVEPHTYTPHMNCRTSTPHLHCVVLAGVGAHASQAQLYLVDGGRFVMPQAVFSDTSGIAALDLDGDGDLDLDVPQNNYQPAYYDGGNYWQTFVLHHQDFTRTGCGRVVYAAMDPAPTAPLTGQCPD